MVLTVYIVLKLIDPKCRVLLPNLGSELKTLFRLRLRLILVLLNWITWKLL